MQRGSYISGLHPLRCAFSEHTPGFAKGLVHFWSAPLKIPTVSPVDCPLEGAIPAYPPGALVDLRSTVRTSSPGAQRTLPAACRQKQKHRPTTPAHDQALLPHLSSSRAPPIEWATVTKTPSQVERQTRYREQLRELLYFWSLVQPSARSVLCVFSSLSKTVVLLLI